MHFGEHDQLHRDVLVQIQSSHRAPEDVVEECGLPQNASLHLMVTPISGCTGFEPAKPN
jgi:hypothetical protein